MQGGADLNELIKSLQAKERNGDVRKHMDYALERNKDPLHKEVARSLRDWDPATMDTARVGQPAPDFELSTISGQRTRLSQFRGKRPVVLVFIYGDT